MMTVILSAEEIFRSLDEKLNTFGDNKIKVEIDEIIGINKSAGNFNFSLSASRNNKPAWVEFFINLIYNMMEVDNKYGRMAACHIFRKLCPILSAKEIINCLSFVIEFGDDDGDSDHSDSEDEEMPEDDEEEDMPSDNEQDDDSDEEFSDINLSSLESLKESMMANNETADIDLDDVPAEELKKYDKRLEKLMKAYHGKLPEDKEFQCRELAQKNIRFRGCDLLKILIKEAVNPTHLVVLVVPLIEAIETEEDNEIKHLLCKLCEDLVAIAIFKQTDNSTVDLVGKELKKLLSTPHDRSGPIWPSSIRFLIKTGQQANNNTASKPIFSAVTQAIDNFFTVRESLITPKVLNMIVSLMRKDFIPICDIFRKHSFSKSGRSIKKNVGLNLLIKSYKDKKRMAEVSLEELKEFQETVSSNILKILNSILRANQIKAKYLLDLFQLMKTIFGLHKKKPACEIGFDWSSIKTAMLAFGARFSNGKLSRSIAKSFSGTANTLQIKHTRLTGKKNKSNQNGQSKGSKKGHKISKKTEEAESGQKLKSKKHSIQQQTKSTNNKPKSFKKQTKVTKTEKKIYTANKKNKPMKHRRVAK